MPPSLSQSFVGFEFGGCSAFGGPDLLGIFAEMHYAIHTHQLTSNLYACTRHNGISPREVVAGSFADFHPLA